MIPMKIAIPIMLIVTFGIVYMVSIPRINVRFANMFKAVEHPKEVNYQSHESTTLRFAAYKAGTNLIKQNFWFGVGTGDMSVEMSRFYKEHNLQGAYIEHISPHNQFMRSFVMHGVFGFLSIVAVFVMMFYLAIKEKHFLLFFWAFIMLVLFNVEDILGIQDGIVYFCFYTSYLVLCPNETKVIKSQLEIIPE
jgi:O-antigen ligase